MTDAAPRVELEEMRTQGSPGPHDVASSTQRIPVLFGKKRGQVRGNGLAKPTLVRVLFRRVFDCYLV
jgi:hypothetical protein